MVLFIKALVRLIQRDLIMAYARNLFKIIPRIKSLQITIIIWVLLIGGLILGSDKNKKTISHYSAIKAKANKVVLVNIDKSIEQLNVDEMKADKIDKSDSEQKITHLSNTKNLSAASVVNCLVETPKDPSLADCNTTLVADRMDIDQLGNRTPIILIHGIHGNQQPDETDLISNLNTSYFDNFREYFQTNKHYKDDFRLKYKVYRFHYVSNMYSVWEVARSLRNHIDLFTNKLQGFDKQFIIIAHSMGGLVARSYMNQHDHNVGQYKGKKGGERVKRLITLATPHNGTPAANFAPRVPTNELNNVAWATVMNLLDNAYWGKWSIREIYKCVHKNCIIGVGESNRSDLRWNNIDGVWDNEILRYVNNKSEKNTWLISLPQTFDHKITAFWGYIGQGNYGIPLIPDDVINLGKMGPIDLATTIKARTEQKLDHLALNVLGILIQRILSRDFRSNITQVDNDGMVPARSAAFGGKRIECPGHDHLDMLDGSTDKKCKHKQGLSLFESIASELGLSAVQSIITKTIIITPDLSMNYGSVITNNNKDQVFTLKNSGNSSLKITNLTLSGINSNEFTIINSPSLPFEIAQDSFRQLTVRFRPTSVGNKQANLIINNNSDNALVKNVTLSGAGVAVGCSYSLSRDSQSFAVNGGNGSFTVNVDTNCNWTISSDSSWIVISSSSNNKGKQVVMFTVVVNSISLLRQGFIVIKGGGTTMTFKVIQDGSSVSCEYSLSSNNKNIKAEGGESNFTVYASSSCTWLATSDTPWLTINSNKNNSGVQVISYFLTTNRNSSTRIGIITIQGQNTKLVFTVSQEGVAQVCTYQQSIREQSVAYSKSQNNFTITTANNCTWQLTSTSPWISLPSISFNGTQTISYSVDFNQSVDSRFANIIVQSQDTTLSIVVKQDGRPAEYPDINLPDKNINIGETLIGSTSYQSIRIKNNGNAQLLVAGIYQKSGSDEFSIIPAVYNIQPGSTGTATVAFTPNSVGSKTSTFSVSNNDPNQSFIEFNITGKGIVQSSGNIDFTWKKISTIPDNDLTDCSVSVIANKIYVMGSGYRNYSFDPTNTIDNMWEILPESRYGLSESGADVINGKIYTIGSVMGNWLQIYDPLSKQWTEKTGPLAERRGASVAAVSKKLYVIGGISTSTLPISTVEEYDPSNDRWTIRAKMITARSYASTAVINNKIYIIGGIDVRGLRSSKVEVYDPAADSWSVREEMPTSLAAQATVVLREKIYVIGGTDNTITSLNKVQEHDPSKIDSDPFLVETWFDRNPIMSARSGAVVGVVNDKIYVIGGVSGNLSTGRPPVTSVEEGSLVASPKINAPVRTIDLGDVPIGSISQKNLTVQNLGNAKLTLTSTATVKQNDFYFSFPSTLTPGQSGLFQVWFEPSQLLNRKATFRINTNDPDAPSIEITVVANGTPAQSLQGGAWQVVQKFSLPEVSWVSEIIVDNGNGYILGQLNNAWVLIIINLANGQVKGTVPLSLQYPRGVPYKLAAVGSKVFVTLGNLGSNGQMIVVNTIDNSILKYVPLGTDPGGIVVIDNQAYITNIIDNGTVQVVDISSYAVSKTLNVGSNPFSIESDPLTKRVYVINKDSVSIVNTLTNDITATLSLTGTGKGVAISGSKALILTNATVEVIDISTNKVITTVPAPFDGNSIISSSSYAFVDDYNNLRIISIANDTLIATLNGFKGISGVAVDSVTDLVYVLDNGDKSISVLSQVSPSFSLSCNPQSLVITNKSVGSTTCTVTAVNNFTDRVELACSMLPAGTSCTFNGSQVLSRIDGIATASLAPSNVLENSALMSTTTATLNINVPASTIPGTYSLKAIGSSGKLTDAVYLGLTIPTCDYTVSPTGRSFESNGGSGNVIISSTTGCAWAATSDVQWITITSDISGNGNGLITYSVQPNSSTSSRTGVLSVAGMTHTITQAGNGQQSTKLSLGEGLNLISLPLQPDNLNISNVLSTINGLYKSVWTINRITGKYSAFFPDNPALSDLLKMEDGSGYWVNMNTEATLNIVGTEPSKKISLESGWNLVSFNSLSVMSITDALAAINDKYTSVWSWNNSTKKFEGYFANNPGLSDLFRMEPGKGYFIFTTQKTDWTLP